MRIVSLLPAATEILCRLGMRESLVAVSHECDYPASVLVLPKITRSRLTSTSNSQQIDQQVRELAQSQTALYDIDEATLRAVQPDVIITQSTCKVCAVSEQEVRELAQQMPHKPQIVTLDPRDLNDVIESIRQVGQAVGALVHAAKVINELQSRIASVADRSRAIVERPQVLLLEWIEPLFSAGHWNPELIQLAGGQAVLGQAGLASRQLEWEEVLSADPDVMVIACCGLSIDRTLDDLPRLVSYRNFSKLACIGEGRVYLVDGSQYFNRSGPRLVDSLELLAHTLHPQVHPLPDYLEAAVRMKREPRTSTA